MTSRRNNIPLVGGNKKAPAFVYLLINFYQVKSICINRKSGVNSKSVFKKVV